MKYLTRILYPTIVCLIVSFAVFPAEMARAVNNFVSMVIAGGYPTGTTINSSGVLTNALTATDFGAGSGGFSGTFQVDGNSTLLSVDVGGGYGSTGMTTTAAGSLSANGNLVIDGTGTITGNSILTSADIGGGAGATGTTITSAGAITTDGAGDFNSTLNVDGNSTLLSVDIGGGSGGSGATITSAGAGTFDATVTANALSIGGGYGSTGVSVSSAGALQVDGQTDLAGGTAADGATFFTDGTTDFAGGYGDSGVSISAAGLIQSDNAITALGALITADYLSVGGGYGSTGITGSAAGALSMDGNLTVGGTITGTMADAELAAIAGLTSAADKAPVFSGSGTAALLTVKSGTWTPTISASVNLDSSSNVVGFYTQIGNQVTCALRGTFDPTAAASTATTFESDLPVASNFANTRNCAGGGAFDKTPGAAVAVYSNATTDKASFQFFSTSTAAGEVCVTFVYTVI